MPVRDHLSSAIASILLCAVVVACGGQAAPPQAGAPTSAGAAATSVSPAATSAPPAATTPAESAGTEPSAAVSPGTTASGTAQLVDPCKIVDREEAAQAFGAPVKAADVTPPAGTVAQCVYESEKASTGFLPDEVGLSVETTWPTRDAFVSAGETLDAGEPLSGFGEAGFQDVDAEDGEVRVSAFKGGISVYVRIRRAGADTGPLLDAAKQLLQQLLDAV